MLYIAIVLGLWRGGGPERIIATVLVAMVVVDKAVHFLFIDYGEATFDQLHLVIDLASLAAMVAVGVTAQRYWPLWASSCQLISVLTHLGWALETKLPVQVYLVLDIAPSTLISGALILGTVRHRRRLAKLGTDSSWKGS